MILSRFTQAFALGLLVLVGLPGPAAQAQDYAAVLAAPDRSEADRQNDAKRQALALLTFSGPKTGWHVLDMGAGGGYSTELMARAVGPSGKVYGQNGAISERFAARAKSPAMANVVALARPFDDPLPADTEKLDLITFFFVYHDTTFMEVDRAKMKLYDLEQSAQTTLADPGIPDIEDTLDEFNFSNHFKAKKDFSAIKL